MKKLLFSFAMIISLSAVSQTVLPKGAKEVQPVALISDSVYSYGWRVTRISSDTSEAGYGEVYLYNRKGSKVFEEGFTIPANVLQAWTIEAFIINRYPRLKKK